MKCGKQITKVSGLVILSLTLSIQANAKEGAGAAMQNVNKATNAAKSAATESAVKGAAGSSTAAPNTANSGATINMNSGNGAGTDSSKVTTPADVQKGPTFCFGGSSTGSAKEVNDVMGEIADVAKEVSTAKVGNIPAGLGLAAIAKAGIIKQEYIDAIKKEGGKTLEGLNALAGIYEEAAYIYRANTGTDLSNLTENDYKEIHKIAYENAVKMFGKDLMDNLEAACRV